MMSVLVAIVAAFPGLGEAATVLARCYNMAPTERSRYVAELEKRNDKQMLLLIARARVKGAEGAATAYVRLASDEEAVKFVGSLKATTRTGHWCAAMNALRNRPKAKVIELFVAAAQSPDPSVRAWAYDVCRRQKWADLAVFAAQDVQNETGVFIPNMEEGLGSLCDYAKMYFGGDVGRFPPEQSRGLKPGM